MGTNYTFFNGEESRHIGKSSSGWTFALHVYPEDGINDLEDWEALFPQGLIQSEFGESFTPEQMMEVITNRLRRAKVDGVFCIGHGKGTWDLIVGEFS